MTGNDHQLKHSVGVILRELHAFARATDAPAGENVFRWAERLSDEVSSSQAGMSEANALSPTHPADNKSVKSESEGA